MIYISLLLFIIAGVTYCISQLQIQGKLKGSVYYSFWGSGSWWLKYARTQQNAAVGIPAPTTYYYKLFNLKYKERFPGSATIFVALTDGYHLMQMIALLAFSASAAVLTPHPWIYLVAFRVTIGITFTVFYKVFAR